MKDLLIRILDYGHRWYGRSFQGAHRLEKIRMVSLRAPIIEAIALYGEPVEKRRSEEFPEVTEYIFNVGPHHDAVIYEWEGAMHVVTYWSEQADPGRDLRQMMTHFGEGQTWEDLTEGYLYLRKDSEVQLWCSATPAIGVGTREYQEAETAYRQRGLLRVVAG